jgi:hypothetical protein
MPVDVDRNESVFNVHHNHNTRSNAGFRNKDRHMKRTWIILAALATCCIPSLLMAQGDEKGKRQRPNMPRPGSGDRPGAGDRDGDRPGNRLGGPMQGGMGFGPNMMMQMMPLMAALDADQDGTLSATEIQNASKALLKLDKNGDGVLSQEELQPDPSKFPGMAGGFNMAGAGPGAPGGGPPSGAMMMQMFERRDANSDGKLSGDEIPEQMRNRLSAIDQNGDGAIQKSELERAANMRGDREGNRPGRDKADGSGVKPKRPE